MFAQLRNSDHRTAGPLLARQDGPSPPPESL